MMIGVADVYPICPFSSDVEPERVDERMSIGEMIALGC